jgi:hypothetical protein|tara:strand:- start:35 stop:334 length:300 start_codon:yes stop_codon:yes gene_type:complete
MNNQNKKSEYYYEYDRNDLNRKNPFLDKELEQIRSEGGFEWTPLTENTIEKYTLTIDDNGVLNLTPKILEATGWKEGDVLEWIDNKDGSFSLVKNNEGI